jgi:hypothetical protein
MIYKLWASLSGSTDGAAALDIREDDQIICVCIELDVIGPADGIRYAAELSFGSTNQINVNDSSSSIISVAFAHEMLTSGMAIPTQRAIIQPRISVSAGERLYLHLLTTSPGGVMSGRAFVYTGGGDRKVSPRRR